MEIPTRLEGLIGVWTGRGSLWFNPAEPPQTTFTTRASVEAAVQANALAITYTWAYENDPQEGLILIGARESGEIEGSWLDSWHMADAFMISRGRPTDTGISVLGDYAASPGGAWGWRTVIEVMTRKEWHVRMYNIPPAGTDELAFELKFETA